MNSHYRKQSTPLHKMRFYTTYTPKRKRLLPRFFRKKESVSYSFSSSRVRGYAYQFEPHIDLSGKTQSYSKFITKVLMISVATMLLLTWWLSSNASIGPLDYEGASSVKTIHLTLPKLAPRLQSSSILQTAEPSFHKIMVGTGDTLSAVFDRYGFKQEDMQKLLAVGGEHLKKLRYLRPGQELTVTLDKLKNISELTMPLSFMEELRFYKKDNKFASEVKKRQLDKQLTIAYGTVDSSLFMAGQQAGLSDQLISELMEIFRWDVDFKPFKTGDKFSVVYEKYMHQGEEQDGNILAAEIINEGKVYRAIRYTDDEGESDYYKPNGERLFKVFKTEEIVVQKTLIIPVSYTRISSKFGMRKHPVYGKMRFHSGVDYSAPYGTSVIAAAEGTVDSVGYMNGYGKAVVLQHGRGYSTLYGHLSKYAKLKVGEKIAQGTVLGYVGSSGVATGNHLHFEVRADDEPQNPLTAELPPETIVQTVEEKTEQEKFVEQTTEIAILLDKASRLNQPSSVAEVPVKEKVSQATAIVKSLDLNFIKSSLAQAAGISLKK